MRCGSNETMVLVCGADQQSKVKRKDVMRCNEMMVLVCGGDQQPKRREKL